MTLIRRVWGAFSLFVYFHYELIVSSLRVAWDVLTPRNYARPGFVVMPLDARSDTEVMLTANLISLTPGTLSIDLSNDRSQLLIHSMFGGDDPEAEVRALKRGIERRVLRATR